MAEKNGRDLFVRGVSPEVRSWLDHRSKQACVSRQQFLLSFLEQARLSDQAPLFLPQPAPPQGGPETLPFKFADLFAGIGGFRLALEKLGGRCVFSSEWDQHSQKTYRAWFGEIPAGDIHKIRAPEIPNHDVLAAGFPCQPFSIAGVSKKKSLGRAHGFDCLAQGNLFFRLASIVEIKRPPVLFLENVKNLQSHDKGNTWRVIRESLEKLNYQVFAKVIDAAGWVPQHRERIYIVGFDRVEFREDPRFEFPEPPAERRPKLSDILDPAPDAKYTLSKHLWQYLQDYAKKHRALGNGFGFGLADPDGIARTLSARYYKDGSEILIAQGAGMPPRRLTPRECARLMGFDERCEQNLVVSDTQAYRQFGNAVVPKVAHAVGLKIVEVLSRHWERTSCLIKRA